MLPSRKARRSVRRARAGAAAARRRHHRLDVRQAGRVLPATCRASSAPPRPTAARCGRCSASRFVYGIFHAAGPGHGKAVISSYLVANEETWRRGIVLSFASALLQAFVAVAIVGIAAVLLNATAAPDVQRRARDRACELRADRAGRRAAHLGQGQGLSARGARPEPAAARGRRRGDAAARSQASRSSITITITITTTTIMTMRSSRSWPSTTTIITMTTIRHASAWGHAHGPEPEELAGPGGWQRGLSAIVAVGLRPCSGAIIVLVFALAQGLFWAGVAATFVMGLGTAITVAAIATLAVGVAFGGQAHRQLALGLRHAGAARHRGRRCRRGAGLRHAAARGLHGGRARRLLLIAPRMAETITTRCCIAGGGPAGMMLGFLLARAGIDVVGAGEARRFPARLPRRHHPSLDAGADARARAARRIPQAAAPGGLAPDASRSAPSASRWSDFRHLPTHCKFIALMPQWDFLNFLAEHGRRYPGFHLLMQAEATDLIEEGGRVVGVRAKTPDGDLEIRAALVVGCDGRHSTVREKRRARRSRTSARRSTCCGSGCRRHDQRHRRKPAATSRPAR